VSANVTLRDLETLPNIRGWQLVSPDAKPRRLSPRERQILELIATGRSQKEVAFDLGLSDATVRVLYSRAMKKLGRRSSRRPRESRV
jgi:DNA-binding NarL/FixJ family response regulator